MLGQAERAGLFMVPLDEVRGWWRYRYLFADLLRTRLQAEQPRRVQELHWAAAWSDEHGLDDDAVRQARRPPGATRPSANWDGPGNWPTWPWTKRAIAGPRPPVLDDLRLADGLTSLARSIGQLDIRHHPPLKSAY